MGKSLTSFNVSENKCSYCNNQLELRNPEFNLDDYSLIEYENFVNNYYDNSTSKNNNTEEFSKYFSFLGDEYFNRKNWNKSLLYYQKALNILIENNENQEKSIETLESNLGNVYMEIGQPITAIEHFNRCLKIQERLYEKKDLLIAWTNNNIANAYFSNMNFENAILHYGVAINILTINDTNDYDALIKLNISLGNALLKKSDFSKSIYHFLEALNFSKNQLDANSPILGHIYCLLGEANAYIGDFENAFFCHQKELEVALPLFEDKDLALIYWKLGSCCQKMNKYEKAISEYLEGFRKSNNKAGGFPFNIGNCYEAINKPKDAMEFYLIASEIRIKELGLTALETIQAINNYNRLAIEFGDKFLNVNDYKPNR